MDYFELLVRRILRKINIKEFSGTTVNLTSSHDCCKIFARTVVLSMSEELFQEIYNIITTSKMDKVPINKSPLSECDAYLR